MKTGDICKRPVVIAGRRTPLGTGRNVESWRQA